MNSENDGAKRYHKYSIFNLYHFSLSMAKPAINFGYYESNFIIALTFMKFDS